nr:retrovirus-related Pol polyprotein from transposon TNT 1-94 [Tanacetum cinerariifolium]
VKATNIILQGLPPEVYTLVSTHKVAKELWECIQMLTQGTSLTKQERECKLYDAFDKFAYQKGETLRTDTSSLVNHNAYLASSSAPQITYAQMDQQSSKLSTPEVGLVVPVFQKGDDLIDAINHMMSFLTSVVASRYPATNNQLRTSSNPRQQATINNGWVTIQPIQGRHNFVLAGSLRPFTSGQGGAQGKQRVITCYNCKGEGHMSKQCTKPRRKRDAEWFKDKVLLSQFQPQATSYQSSPYGPTYPNSQLTHSTSYPGTDTSSVVNHNAYMTSSSAPQIAYAQMDQQLSEYSPPEAGLVDGPIDH